MWLEAEKAAPELDADTQNPVKDAKMLAYMSAKLAKV